MIAFTVFGRPIYWYGIFYLCTFIWGYFFLRYVGKKEWCKPYPGVQHLLTEKLDDFFIVCILGVMLGGRLGHVLLYDWTYYSQNIGEILLINQGGMSFIGGVIGVTIGLLWFMRKEKLTKNELLLIGDLVLCIVPLGIFLGRIGNYLNQELRGKSVGDISVLWANIFSSLNLLTVYENVDGSLRVNTNIIESILEGIVPFIIVQWLFITKYLKKKMKPGMISGTFLILYAIGRFFVEYFKDLPAQEIHGWFSISQWIMILFFFSGLYLLGSISNTMNSK